MYRYLVFITHSVTWGGLLISYWWLVSCGVIRFDPEVIELVKIYLAGASLGYLLSTVGLSRSFVLSNTLGSLKLRKHVSRFLYLRFSIFITIAAGLLFFINNGVGLSSDYLKLARESYNESKVSDSPLLYRVSSLMFVMNMSFIILSVIRKSNKSLSLTLIFLICSSPFFLANATRTFLIYPFVYLFFAKLASNQIDLYFLKKISVFVVVFGLFFAVFGRFRGGYNDLTLFQTILIWPASSLVALPAWTETVNELSLHGYLTLDYVSNIDFVKTFIYKQEFLRWQLLIDKLSSNHTSILVVPMTLIGRLSADFGASNLFVSSFIYSYTLGAVFRLSGSGNSGVFLKTIVLYSTFMTIQTSVFNAGNVSVLFFCYFLNNIISEKSF